MTQVERKVTLMFHTQMAEAFREQYDRYPMGRYDGNDIDDLEATDGQLLALTAIRTCYSPGKPTEIIAKEGAKYFKVKASDGGKGSDADRLVRMIKSSGHTSTFEGITFNFAVEGVSRALLAQLTRHRVGFGFSVQSQRYVRFGSGDRSGGFDYVLPETVEFNDKLTVIYGIDRVVEDDDGNIVEIVYNDEVIFEGTAAEYFDYKMREIQRAYDTLRALGVPPEDARAVLPNAATVNLVLSVNLRALLDFYGKRRKGNGAQAEIAGLAEDLKNAVIAVEPWCEQLFEATV